MSAVQLAAANCSSCQQQLTIATMQPWTEDETQQLSELVQQHGAKWTLIAQKLPSRRNSKQCRRRYNNFIKLGDNRKDNAAWTAEEDALLLSCYEELGNRWTDIAARLSGRTDNAAKVHSHAVSPWLQIACGSSLNDRPHPQAASVHDRLLCSGCVLRRTTPLPCIYMLRQSHL